MNLSKVSYADIVEDGEYFCHGPYSGFYVSASLADLIKDVESGAITGPEDEPITEIHHNGGYDLSRKVWSA